MDAAGDDGTAQFCEVDYTTKEKFAAWLKLQSPMINPTFVTIAKARKEFSEHTLYPTLGIETTLPQYRQSVNAMAVMPGQDQYPVWYFFYGTLASKAMLASLFTVEERELEDLKSATVVGGRVGKWGRRYNALVDGSSAIEGHAFLVGSAEREDNLRRYETHAYEVVRCRMVIDGAEVLGCTFRFLGELD